MAATSSSQSASQQRDAPDASSFNPIVFDAAASGRIGVVVSAARRYPGLVDAANPNQRGNIPLCVAARNGRADVVEQLVRLGSAALDQPNNYGATPMYIAAQNGHMAVVETLHRLGSAALDQPNFDGTTPMHVAARNGHVAVVETLHRLGSAALDQPMNDGTTPMFIAARNGHAAVVETLHRLGSTALDQPMNDGTTPMFIAAENGHAVVVETLHRLGSTALDQPMNGGWTPMYAAAFDGHTAVVETLVRCGSQALNTPVDSGHTPLTVAAQQGHADVVQLLLRMGADRSENASGLMRQARTFAAAEDIRQLFDTIPAGCTDWWQDEVQRQRRRVVELQQKLDSERQAAARRHTELRGDIEDCEHASQLAELRRQLDERRAAASQFLELAELRADADRRQQADIARQLDDQRLRERVAQLENELHDSRNATAIVSVFRQWGVERTIFTKRTGEVPAFEAAGAKRGGTALGTMYKEVATGRDWLGKVGNPSDDSLLGVTQRDTYRRLTKLSMNFDAIQEKLAYDLFEYLGDGHYRVPDSLVSEQPIIDHFTRTHQIALAWAADQQLAHDALGDRDLAPDDRYRLSNESLRLMTEYMDGYQDLHYARCSDDDDSQTPIEFMAYIERYHRPPEQLLTPDGRRVALSGLMELLAVGRLLADIDLIGGRGMNAGFIWTHSDGSSAISGAQVVKIDPGMAFKFGDDSGRNWVRNTHLALPNNGFRCADARDLQVAAQNTAVVISWSALSVQQRHSFLQALGAAQNKLQHNEVMEFLLYRHGRYNRSTMEMVPYPTIERWTHDFSQWNAMQSTIFAADLASL